MHCASWQVYKYVLQCQIANVTEVAEFVASSEISKIDLQEEDVYSVSLLTICCFFCPCVGVVGI